MSIEIGILIDLDEIQMLKVIGHFELDHFSFFSGCVRKKGLYCAPPGGQTENLISKVNALFI